MFRLILLVHKLFSALPAVLTVIWLSCLADTDSSFSVYAMIAFLSFWLQIRTMQAASGERTGKSVLCGILSVVFSLLVLLANYTMFTPAAAEHYTYATSVLRCLVNAALTFAGGICVAMPILRWFLGGVSRKSLPQPAWLHARWLPWAAFGGLLVFHLGHLFFAAYPGNLTQDTFAQIREMVSGDYSNFNTFYHTMLFQGGLTMGYRLFGEVNAAAAFACALQCLILCASFAYCLVTMRDYGAPWSVLAGAWAVYALMPYHLSLSAAVWKDVLFAAATLLVLCSWLRVMKGLGRRPVWNYMVFILGSLLFLLSRSVGWVLYAIAFAAALIFSRRCRKLLAVMGAMTAAGWLLMNPVLSWLDIPAADRIESLNLPIQQVSRVIAEDCPLSQEEEALLGRIIDLEAVEEIYTPNLSDPMKRALRQEDPGYFDSHISELGELWLRLGLRYPAVYLKAWIDLTRGYWNGGYFVSGWAEAVTENPYGIAKAEQTNLIARFTRLYFNASRHMIFLEPLFAIGLRVWITLLCFLRNMVRKREQAVLWVPLAATVLGLLMGAPAYCLFRYVYPLFACFPLLLTITVYDETAKAE